MTPTVPDGPDTELAAAIAYLQPSMHGPGIENEIRFDREAQRHAATIVRAALARPAAGRDLTGDDVRTAFETWEKSGDGFGEHAGAYVAELLNAIARPAVARTDGQPPAGCGLCSPKALRDDDPDLLTGYSGNDDGEEPAAPADGPMCRYCGADCSGGRSWDGGDFYACPSCADARATRNVAPADDTAATDRVELLGRACKYAESVVFGDHPEDAPGTVRDGLADGWMAGYLAAGQPVRGSQPEATRGGDPS